MPSVSPDGRWLAFASDESGQSEVYVQMFPGPGERVRVSTMGGAQPEWRQDGRGLFFVGLDDRLMTVPVQASTDGRSLELGEATPLFPVRIFNGAVQTGGLGSQYVVSPDGQRFLVVSLTDDASPSQITPIENWWPTGTR
ncbi:MAG: hypothetical protein HOP16_17520 [Acidobacteria bacterium]|nr:hypothetical protein [Acidobacteriota bacterium]